MQAQLVVSNTSFLIEVADEVAESARNECHVSVAATSSPHARAYELALDEDAMEDATCNRMTKAKLGQGL